MNEYGKGLCLFVHGAAEIHAQIGNNRILRFANRRICEIGLLTHRRRGRLS